MQFLIQSYCISCYKCTGRCGPLSFLPGLLYPSERNLATSPVRFSLVFIRIFSLLLKIHLPYVRSFRIVRAPCYTSINLMFMPTGIHETLAHVTRAACCSRSHRPASRTLSLACDLISSGWSVSRSHSWLSTQLHLLIHQNITALPLYWVCSFTSYLNTLPIKVKQKYFILSLIQLMLSILSPQSVYYLILSFSFIFHSRLLLSIEQNIHQT